MHFDLQPDTYHPRLWTLTERAQRGQRPTGISRNLGYEQNGGLNFLELCFCPNDSSFRWTGCVRCKWKREISLAFVLTELKSWARLMLNLWSHPSRTWRARWACPVCPDCLEFAASLDTEGPRFAHLNVKTFETLILFHSFCSFVWFQGRTRIDGTTWRSRSTWTQGEERQKWWVEV